MKLIKVYLVLIIFGFVTNIGAQTVDELILHATTLNQNGLYRDAIVAYDKVITAQPEFPYTYYLKAKCYVHIKDYYSAIREVSTAIRKDNTFIDALFLRASLKAIVDDYRGSLVDYNRIVLLSPENPLAYFGRALTKLSLNDIDGACLDFSKAGDLGYTDPKLLYDNIRKYCN